MRPTLKVAQRSKLYWQNPRSALKRRTRPHRARGPEQLTAEPPVNQPKKKKSFPIPPQRSTNTDPTQKSDELTALKKREQRGDTRGRIYGTDRLRKGKRSRGEGESLNLFGLAQWQLSTRALQRIRALARSESENCRQAMLLYGQL